MDVWVLETGDDSYSMSVAAVFSTKERALAAANSVREPDYWHFHEWHVYRLTVDEDGDLHDQERGTFLYPKQDAADPG